MNFSTIDCLSSGIPSILVYFVYPLFIASIAASLTCLGVSKSGSPEDSPITFFPSLFNCAALAVMTIVADGFILFKVSEINDIS